MALENKAQKLKRESLEALSRIVEATLDASIGFTYCSDEIAGWLVKNEYVEQNEAIKNVSGHLATRATEKGIKLVESLKPKEEVKVSEETVIYVIENVALAPVKRGAGLIPRVSKYPFDKLEVGQSFFVAGKYLKGMASTVNNAAKKYATVEKNEDGTDKTKVGKNGKDVKCYIYTRKFGVRSDEVNGVAGVRVGRTA